MTGGNRLVQVFAALAGLFKGNAGQTVREPVLVRGTRVYLTPPAGFVEAENYCGFQSTQLQASILITEMPAPFSQMAAGMDAVHLAARGIKLLTRESTELSGSHGLLIHAQQKGLGIIHEKWIAVFGNSHSTVMLMATFPAEDEFARDVTRHCILGALWDPEVSVDPLADLPFVVCPPEGMMLTNRMHMTLAYTTDGQTHHPSARDPIFVIGQSIGKEDTADLESFAKNRLLKTEGYHDFEIKRERALSIDNLDSYEIDVDATDTRRNEPVAIYQLIISSPDQTTYFIAQGIVHRELAPEYLPKFERSAHSFLLR